MSVFNFSFLRIFFLLLVSVLLFQGCTFTSKEEYNKGYKEGFQDGVNAIKKANDSIARKITVPQSVDPNLNVVKKEDKKNNNTVIEIPPKVYQVLDYIKQNKRAPDGYVGGRHFGNYEHHLPEHDASGATIEYQEWDVNPKTEGKNRGTERLITGSDGKSWYTNDHYNSFTEVK